MHGGSIRRGGRAEPPARLIPLGWRPFFEARVEAGEMDSVRRVIGVRRSGHVVSNGERRSELRLGRHWHRQPAERRPTVGDWVVLDAGGARIARCLPRQTELRRMAAGGKAELQLIGANVDALFVVSSCNAEFSAARLQRYLAVAADAGVRPLVALTKADLSETPDDYARQTRRIAGAAPVTLVNALDAATLDGVRAGMAARETVALLGSSGVGKTTLLNTLAGAAVGATGAVREGDAKGRHTTSERWLHVLPSGALVLDGPGVREFGVAVGEGDAWAAVEALAADCRFKDCRHGDEPGCALRAAVAAGELRSDQLGGYRKLQEERARHAARFAAKERRASHAGRRRRERAASADDDLDAAD